VLGRGGIAGIIVALIACGTIIVSGLDLGKRGTNALFSDRVVSTSNVFVVGRWLTMTPTPTATPTTVPPIAAKVKITPKSLEKKSKGSSITALVELPSGYDASQIDVGTVLLCLASDPLEPCAGGATADGKPKVGDADQDGIPDLKITFERSQVIGLVDDITAPAEVVFAVSGEAKNGTFTFMGVDTVKLVDPESSTPVPTGTAAAGVTATTTATLTPTVVPSVSPMPTQISTPAGSATAMPTRFPPTESPTATSTETPVATAIAAETPTPLPTLMPSSTPTPNVIRTPTSALTETPTPSPTETPTLLLTAAATSTPSATPIPKNSPRPTDTTR